MDVYSIIEEIRKLELSSQTSLEWWDKEKVDRIGKLIAETDFLLKSIPSSVSTEQFQKIHEFLRTLQHIYKMHDKNLRVSIKALCSKYNLSGTEALDRWIDGACEGIRASMKAKPRISLVISMWNGRADIIEMTEKMFFDSIIRFGLPKMEIVIVDDASPLKKETDDMLSRVVPALESKGHQVIVIKSGVNLGYTHSYNVGLRRATGDIVFLSNTDVRISAGAMLSMQEIMLKNPNYVSGAGLDKLNIGIVGPMLTGVAGYVPQSATKALKVNSYEQGEISRLDSFGQEFNRLNRDAQPIDVKFVVGSFMAVARSVFQAVGFLDEKFKNGYAEETDFCYTARKAGFSVAVARNVFIFHGGTTRSKLSENMDFSGQSTSVRGSHLKNQLRAIFNERHFLWNHGLKASIEKTKQFQKPEVHKHLPLPKVPDLPGK